MDNITRFDYKIPFSIEPFKKEMHKLIDAMLLLRKALVEFINHKITQFEFKKIYYESKVSYIHVFHLYQESWWDLTIDDKRNCFYLFDSCYFMFKNLKSEYKNYKVKNYMRSEYMKIPNSYNYK
jgi:hypothetical protein